MNSIDSNWLLKFEEDNDVRWLEPSRLRIREKIESSTIVPKLLSWMNPNLRGRKVFYQASSNGKYMLGHVPNNDEYCSIWLADENPNQGFLSFNILYNVIGQDKISRHMPYNSLLVTLDRPVSRSDPTLLLRLKTHSCCCSW